MKLPRCHRHTDAQSAPGTPRSLTEALRKPSARRLHTSKASKSCPDATDTPMPNRPQERQEASRRPHGNLPQEACTFPSHQNRKICKKSLKIVSTSASAMPSRAALSRAGSWEAGSGDWEAGSGEWARTSKADKNSSSCPIDSTSKACPIEDRSQFLNRQRVFCIVFYTTL